jgi:hypothetical protein
MDRRKVFATPSLAIRPGLLLLAGSLAFSGLAMSQSLWIEILALLLVWTSAFVLCYGINALTAARFPILFLLLMAPIPVAAMDWIVGLLQR